jgi:hypothetical protein
MTVMGSGKVGIGTDTPLYPLHVRGNIIRLQGSGTTRSDWGVGANDASLNVYDDSTSQYEPYTLYAETFKFLSGTSANSQGLFQDSAGKVGIGTTGPGALLSLNGQGTSPALQIQRAGASTAQWKFIMTEGSAYTTTRGTALSTWSNVMESSNSNLVLTTDDDGGTGGTITIDSDTFYINGVCLPSADNSQNLGSTSKRWANLYVADVQLSNENTGGNEVDGTEGKWSLQEGEDDLFVINRKTGKKFKIKLEEM